MLRASAQLYHTTKGFLLMAQTAAPVPLRSSVVYHPRRRGIVGFFTDIVRGALLGDFALDLGIAGAITQVALAYTPIVGDICSIRDMVGDLYHRDKLGFLLSMLALVPILGGIAKTIDVIHNTRRVGHALVRTRQRHAQSH